MNQPAVRFLNRCFTPGETIALLLRRESPPSITQRVVRLERALEPRYQAWLSYENGSGASIYVAANPLLPGTRKRTKESIGSVRHLYIDIDIDGDARLAALRASDLVPPPSSILSTSPGKYQALWRVEGFDFDRQEQTLKGLAMTFGGDPACTDSNRVLRVPGFLNHKYDPAFRVAVEYPDDSIWTPDDFRLDAGSVDGLLCAPAIPSCKPPSKHSHSENDWAWVCDQLSHGEDAVKLTRKLTSRRSDKPNPLYYAQRTVDVASARLWLLEGIRIDDVITMLESRRRFEIPTPLCVARARENIAPALGVSYGGKIALLPGQSKAEEFVTLVHEIAHELLHKTDRRTKTTATVRETEAEAVAFIVGQGIGLDMGRASSDYIQMYAGNAALLAESLEVVQRTSAVILGAITVEAIPEATPAAEEPVAEVA